jgi:hypothetical protein
MLNDKATGTGLVLIIFTSLIFSTIMISWFMLQIYGVSLAGIDLSMGNQSFSSSQNFLTNQINMGTIRTSDESIWTYQTGIGKVLTSFNSGIGGGLYINNIQPKSDGIIINDYVINNSVHGEYSIILNTNAQGSGGKLVISNDGVYRPYFFGNVLLTIPKVVNYAGMKDIDDVTIRTVYNENLNTVDLTFNGNTYTITDIQKDLTAVNLGHFYGGVESKTAGFTIKSFNTDTQIQVSQDTDAVTMFYAFIVIALKLVFYNVSPDMLPWELNILLIKTQTIGLLIGIYSMIRSGT